MHTGVMASKHTARGVEHTAMPVSPDELAERVRADRTVVGGRFTQLPVPVRPDETIEVTYVETGDEESLADKHAVLRMLMYTADDG